MRCHVPGTAWQKACSRPSGSTAGPAVGAKTTPDVPSESAAMPGHDRSEPDRVGGLVAAAADDRRARREPGRRCAPRRDRRR